MKNRKEMKYIKEYMKEELGLMPLGNVELEEVDEGVYLVRVCDKTAALEVSWSDYAMYLEKKYDELKSEKQIE